MSRLKRKVPFSEEDDDYLIGQVSGNEFMWNTKHDEFKNTYKKDLVWQVIMDNLGRTKEECQSRWKNIRDHYKKQVKKNEKNGNPPDHKKKRAGYWDRISFLEFYEDEEKPCSKCSTGHQRDPLKLQEETTLDHLPFVIKTEPTDSEMYEESEEQLEPQVSTQSTNATVKTFLHNKSIPEPKARSSSTIQEEDDVDLFFKSIAFSVKKLKPHLITKTKVRVIEVLAEMEQMK